MVGATLLLLLFVVSSSLGLALILFFTISIRCCCIISLPEDIIIVVVFHCIDRIDPTNVVCDMPFGVFWGWSREGKNSKEALVETWVWLDDVTVRACPTHDGSTTPPHACRRRSRGRTTNRPIDRPTDDDRYVQYGNDAPTVVAPLWMGSQFKVEATIVLGL